MERWEGDASSVANGHDAFEPPCLSPPLNTHGSVGLTRSG
jgi:hypothetical protein